MSHLQGVGLITE